MKNIKLGLCQGRHEIPGIEGYIFDNIADPTNIASISYVADKALFGKYNLAQGDRVDLYVTGLTVALIEVLRACMWEGVTVTLWHFNRDTGDYYPQPFNAI